MLFGEITRSSLVAGGRPGCVRLLGSYHSLRSHRIVLLLDALKIDLLHGTKLVVLAVSSWRATRKLRHLLIRLNVPLGVLKELINVLAKHLLEVHFVEVLTCSVLLFLR